MLELMAGNAKRRSMKNSTTKEMEPQMSSLVAGRIGLGASWQAETSWPFSRSLMHSSFACFSFSVVGVVA